MKVCGKCKEVLSLDCFQKNRVAPDGLQYRCKACTKIASKACRDKRSHLWLQKTNPWKKRNRERSNAAVRARRARNPEKAREENRYWRSVANPFCVAAAKAKIRAEELGVVSTLTSSEWEAIVERRNYVCHLCGDKVSLDINSPLRISLDHVIPMSKGGGNTADNVLPAHRRCNQSRLDMTMEEFDIWLDKIYLSRRSGHGACEEPKFISQPPPSLEKVDCIAL